MRKPSLNRGITAIFVALFIYFMTRYFNDRPPIIQNELVQLIVGIILAGLVGYFMIKISDEADDNKNNPDD